MSNDQGQTAGTDGNVSDPDASLPKVPINVPRTLVATVFTYLVALLVLFVVYVSWKQFRTDAPTTLGPLPVGVVWFGAIGAVISSFRGLFAFNAKWDNSYNLWHYSRPLFGAVTGSIGALMYWVLLTIGSTAIVDVRVETFYVVAFVLGFADKAFVEMLQNVTNVIVKPGSNSSQQ